MYLLDQLQQNIPVGLSFRVVGETGHDYWGEIRSRQDLAGDFDFQLDANSANSNPAIQQEQAQEIMNFVLNPLLIQMQVVGVGNIYEASRNFFKSRGIKDFGRFLTKPADHQIFLNPQQEASRILNNIPVPVLPAQDHDGFIKLFQELVSSDELLGAFSKEEVFKLAAQSQKHEQMKAALADAAAQSRNQRQAALNQQLAIGPAEAANPTDNAIPPQQAPVGGQA